MTRPAGNLSINPASGYWESNFNTIYLMVLELILQIVMTFITMDKETDFHHHQLDLLYFLNLDKKKPA
jgi:hypothetical protein